MNSGAFDALARRAGSAQDRRTSLKALGAAGLGAALSAPIASEAKKKKNCKKKVKQKCNGQIEDCQNSTEVFCEGNQSCLDALLPCCDLLADCEAGSAVTCIYDAFTMDSME
jgi:hypothetical protein